MKHTPGKWIYEYYRDSPQNMYSFFIENEDGFCIVDVLDNGTDEMCKANAQLIAAAPDLLEACNAVRKYFKIRRLGSVADQMVVILSKAIAKATKGDK